jgi:hypothetical protein
VQVAVEDTRRVDGPERARELTADLEDLVDAQVSVVAHEVGRGLAGA